MPPRYIAIDRPPTGCVAQIAVEPGITITVPRRDIKTVQGINRVVSRDNSLLPVQPAA
jgi:hypothetical protein